MTTHTLASHTHTQTPPPKKKTQTAALYTDVAARMKQKGEKKKGRKPSTVPASLFDGACVVRVSVCICMCVCVVVASRWCVRALCALCPLPPPPNNPTEAGTPPAPLQTHPPTHPSTTNTTHTHPTRTPPPAHTTTPHTDAGNPLAPSSTAGAGAGGGDEKEEPDEEQAEAGEHEGLAAMGLLAGVHMPVKAVDEDQWVQCDK